MKAKKHQKATPMVLYLAEGKWSKEIEEFAVWSYHYDMWCKMTFLSGLKGCKSKRELALSPAPVGLKNRSEHLCPLLLNDESHVSVMKVII